MICPHCNKPINDDVKFCGKCGKRIPRCPTCGQVIWKRSQFCPSDGTKLPADVIALFSDGSKPMPTPGPNPIPPKPTPTPEPNPAPKPKPTPKSTPVKKKGPAAMILCVVLIVLIIALLCGAAYWVGNGGIDGLLNSSHQSSISSGDTSDSKNEDSDSGDSSEEENSQTAPEEDNPASSVAKEEPEVPVDNPIDAPIDTGGEQDTEVTAMTSEEKVLNFIENCDRVEFSLQDLESFDADMCRLARNGIYARLGRKFNDETLQAYFERYNWYRPTIDPEDFDESLLNDYQVKNRDLIIAYEQQKGYR